MFLLGKEADHVTTVEVLVSWLQKQARNILLDRLAHQVGPTGVESERMSLSSLQKD
jgi:hypothetical protein